MGTPTQFTSFNHTISNSTAFTHDTQFNSTAPFNNDVSLSTRLLINSPLASTSTVSIKAAATSDDGALKLYSDKPLSPYYCAFFEGGSSHVILNSAKAIGAVFIQTHAGPVCVIE